MQNTPRLLHLKNSIYLLLLLLIFYYFYLRLFLNIFYSIRYAFAVNKTRHLFFSLPLSSRVLDKWHVPSCNFIGIVNSATVNYCLYYVLAKLASSNIHYLWNFNARGHLSNDVDLATYHVETATNGLDDLNNVWRVIEISSSRVLVIKKSFSFLRLFLLSNISGNSTAQYCTILLRSNFINPSIAAKGEKIMAKRGKRR